MSEGKGRRGLWLSLDLLVAALLVLALVVPAAGMAEEGYRRQAAHVESEQRLGRLVQLAQLLYTQEGVPVRDSDAFGSARSQQVGRWAGLGDGGRVRLDEEAHRLGVPKFEVHERPPALRSDEQVCVRRLMVEEAMGGVLGKWVWVCGW